MRGLGLGIALAGLAADAHAVDVVDKKLENRAFERVRLKLGGYVQPRFTSIPVDEDAGSPGLLGFNVQRARLEIFGELLPAEHRRYGFRLANEFSLELAGRNGAILQDAWFEAGFGTVAQLRFGQFKAPVHRANLVSDENNLFPDRNRITFFANLPNRDIGLMFHGYWNAPFAKRFLEYQVGIWNGEGENRIASNRKFLYVGRFVIAPLGSPGPRYEILRDWHNDDAKVWWPSFSLGGSVHQVIQGTPGEEQSFFGLNGEMFLHWRWLTVMSEVLWRTTDYERQDVADFDQFGWYVQAGLFPPMVPWAQNHLALMGRVEQADEYIATGGADVPPTGALDPNQATRRYSVGLGLYAGRPLFTYVQDLRLVFSYTFKQELEGFEADNDEFNISANLSF